MSCDLDRLIAVINKKIENKTFLNMMVRIAFSSKIIIYV